MADGVAAAREETRHATHILKGLDQQRSEHAHDPSASAGNQVRNSCDITLQAGDTRLPSVNEPHNTKEGAGGFLDFGSSPPRTPHGACV